MVAENALIASIVQDLDKGLAAISDLTEEDFSSSACRVLLNVIRGFHAENRHVNIVTLADYLTTNGLLTRVGGAEGIVEILDTVPSPAMLHHYKRLVIEASVVRAINEIKAESKPPDATVEEWVEGISGRIAEQQMRLSGLSKGDEIAGIDALDEAFDRLEASYTRGLEFRAPRLNIPTIDMATGGFEPGEMWVLAGPTKSGKSILGVQVLSNWLVDQAGSAYVASMEMSAWQYASRLITHQSRVNLDRVSQRLATQAEFERIASATARVREACNGRLEVLQRRDTSVEGLCSRLLAKSKRPELLIVDYLQLLKPSDHKQDRHLQVAHISTRLKELAERVMMPVIVLSQLNDDGRTRESRVIEQDCDGLIRIEDVPEDPEHVWLHLALHRAGRTCRVYCDAQRDIAAFRESALTPPPPDKRKGSKF